VNSKRRMQRNRNSVGLGAGLVLSAILLMGPMGTVWSQPPAIVPEMEIDQELLMGDGYDFRKIIESGRHLFSTPYHTLDGHGEGPDGPRRSTQMLFDAPQFRFLRLNGLDSQSCFECHNTIGSANLPDMASQALGRKGPVTGGSAGFASTAFINPNFPDQLVTFLRNPPHVFGTGYGQQLAEEMTLELMAQRDAAKIAAMLMPGQEIRQPLISKGVNFGEYRVTYEMHNNGGLSIKDALGHGADGDFVEDTSAVAGVSEDLVVRPFQWKGNASNERNFVKDALNFHFGMQPVEFFFAEDPGDPNQVIITETDADRDGVENEMSPGNVSALTIFTMSIRPPTQIIPEGKEAIVERGRQIFEGEVIQTLTDAPQSCSTCHRPTMRINSSEVVVLDPTHTSNLETLLGEKVGLSNQRASVEMLPAVRRYRKIIEGLDEKSLRDPNSILKAVKTNPAMPVGYHFDLTEMDSLPLSFPRLTENPDGTIDVPIFTDMRRHDMGEALADVSDMPTDTAGVIVPAREFLTRPLWGVADTGPWMHDGRALTLREAILLHDSPGSEASEAVQTFLSFDPVDQDALIEFLLTLRLPVESQEDGNSVNNAAWLR